MQKNYCDCGLFLLGYVKKFMTEPRNFLNKLLNKELNGDGDWSDLNPQLMRAEIREMLFGIEKVQSKERRQRKKKLMEQKRRKREVEVKAQDGSKATTAPNNDVHPLSAEPVSEIPSSIPVEDVPLALQFARDTPVPERNSVEGELAAVVPESPVVQANPSRCPSSSPSRYFQAKSWHEQLQDAGEKPHDGKKQRRMIDPDKHLDLAEEDEQHEKSKDGDNSVEILTVD